MCSTSRKMNSTCSRPHEIFSWIIVKGELRRWKHAAPLLIQFPAIEMEAHNRCARREAMALPRANGDTVVGRIAVFNAADAAWRAACGDMVRLRDEMREQLAAGLEH